MKVFRPGSPEYADAFHLLIRSTDERIHVKRLLKSVMSSLKNHSAAVDWGAGNGALTQELLQYFSVVYAVEPNPELQQYLVEKYPTAKVFPTGILETDLPSAVDIGIMSHMLYYLPEETWAEVCLQAASNLTEEGVLVVVLKHLMAAENQMFEAFGAPRCDLSSILDRFKTAFDYEVTFLSTPGRFMTTSYQDTLDIARFMLSDRSSLSHSAMPSEQEFQDYVTQHFWDEDQQRGGWDCPQQIAIIRRNAFRGQTNVNLTR